MASDAAPQSAHSSCWMCGMVLMTCSLILARRGNFSRTDCVCMSLSLSGQKGAEQARLCGPDLGLADHAVVERVLFAACLERARGEVGVDDDGRAGDRQGVADRI